MTLRNNITFFTSYFLMLKKGVILLVEMFIIFYSKCFIHLLGAVVVYLFVITDGEVWVFNQLICIVDAQKQECLKFTGDEVCFKFKSF